MILKIPDLSNNLKTPKKFYLLYGLNTGLIDETINNILKPKLSKNIYNYDENEIIFDIQSFIEKILNKSFFDNDKLIIINRASDKILEIVNHLNKKDIFKTNFIIKTGALDKKSKLRLFFEKSKEAICIPFYDDDYKSLLTIAQRFISDHSIKISMQNLNYIIEKSKNNRIKLREGLEKINYFFLNKSSISFQDILKLINSGENYNLSELADQILVKNKKNINIILNDNMFSDEEYILTIRLLIFKLKRLKKIKEKLIFENNQELVLASYKPPIFWKDKIMIKNQLKILSLYDIKDYIKKINKLELLVKKNVNLSNKIINNFIFEKTNASNNLI